MFLFLKILVEKFWNSDLEYVFLINVIFDFDLGDLELFLEKY